MALLPGKRFEISSHFMPEPRSSMITASSSGVHLDWRLAGEAAGWGEDGGGRLLAGWKDDGGSSGPGAWGCKFRGEDRGGGNGPRGLMGCRSCGAASCDRTCPGDGGGWDRCDCSLMEGSDAFGEGSTRDVTPDALDDVEVRWEDAGWRFPVEGSGTDADRADGLPAGPPTAAGGDGAGDGGGLVLSSSDMSSLAVVRVRGA